MDFLSYGRGRRRVLIDGDHRNAVGGHVAGEGIVAFVIVLIKGTRFNACNVDAFGDVCGGRGRLRRRFIKRVASRRYRLRRIGGVAAVGRGDSQRLNEEREIVRIDGSVAIVVQNAEFGVVKLVDFLTETGEVISEIVRVDDAVLVKIEKERIERRRGNGDGRRRDAVERLSSGIGGERSPGFLRPSRSG